MSDEHNTRCNIFGSFMLDKGYKGGFFTKKKRLFMIGTVLLVTVTLGGCTTSKNNNTKAIGNEKESRIKMLTTENINFIRTGFSNSWQRTQKPPRPELEDLCKNLHGQNYFIITGSSEGSKIFEVIGLDKMEHLPTDWHPKEIGLNILTLYSDILTVKKTKVEVLIQVKPKDAGYDNINVDPSVLPSKELDNGSKGANFVFIDDKGNVLDRITHVF